MWDDAIWRGRYERYTPSELAKVIAEGGEHAALAEDVYRRRGREAAVEAGAWPRERLRDV